MTSTKRVSGLRCEDLFTQSIRRLIEEPEPTAPPPASPAVEEEAERALTCGDLDAVRRIVRDERARGGATSRRLRSLDAVARAHMLSRAGAIVEALAAVKVALAIEPDSIHGRALLTSLEDRHRATPAPALRRR